MIRRKGHRFTAWLLHPILRSRPEDTSVEVSFYQHSQETKNCAGHANLSTGRATQKHNRRMGRCLHSMMLNLKNKHGRHLHHRQWDRTEHRRSNKGSSRQRHRHCSLSSSPRRPHNGRHEDLHRDPQEAMEEAMVGHHQEVVQSRQAFKS